MNHTPVLLEEAIDFLKPEKGKYFIDATVDGGGHSEIILSRLPKDGVLIGIDRDENMLQKAKERFKEDKRFIGVAGNFSDIYEIGTRFAPAFDGIIFDLGISSYQLEESGRGFSFLKDEPLDMRFDVRGGITAKDIVNSWDEARIGRIIKEYGEERFARRIARSIVVSRNKKQICTSHELAGIITKAIPARFRRGKINPATRTFQALRIAVNDELHFLSKGTVGAFTLLKPHARLVIISFHSLEDRIVKQTFRELAKNSEAVILTKKPVVPSKQEILFNPRSRSAKLRAVEKVIR